jgi:hypothetical protein
MEAVPSSETAAECYNPEHHNVPAAAKFEFHHVTHIKTYNATVDVIITALVRVIKRMFNCVRGVECLSPQGLRVGC